MKVVEPRATIMNVLDLMPIEQRIERCGRLCYKSEGEITDNSYTRFITKIRDNGHNSVLEMAVVSLRVVVHDRDTIDSFLQGDNKYIVIDEIGDGVLLVTGSIRAFRELYDSEGDHSVVFAIAAYLSCAHQLLFEDKGIDPVSAGDEVTFNKVSVKKMPMIEIMCLMPWVKARHRFVAVHFVVNRAVSHELVRHRPCSFLQESQRYCRYDKDQFGGEVTFIRPIFYESGSVEYAKWWAAMEASEHIYLDLLKRSSPQAARTVLPNSCKTEIIVFANLAQWAHIFRLRVSLAADPSMREVMTPLLQQFRDMWPECFCEWVG